MKRGAKTRAARRDALLRSTKVPPLARLVLDSGGLTALCGSSHAARQRLMWVSDHLGDVVIPSPILAECTTGSGARDAEVNRILGILTRDEAMLVAPDEATSRRAGKLRFDARTARGIDALVAAVAVGDGSPAVVLTSDPRDMERLLASERQVHVRKV